MAKDSSENLSQNPPQEEDIESADADVAPTGTNESEDINTENNNSTSADKEADIDKLEHPQTQKSAQNNLSLIIIALIVAVGAVIAYFWITGKKDKTPTQDKVPFTEKKPDTASKLPAPLLQKSSRVPKNIVAVTPPKPKTLPKTISKSPPAPAVPKLLAPDKITHPKDINTDEKTPFSNNNRRNTKIKSSIMLKNSSDTNQTKTNKNNIDSSSADGVFNPEVIKAKTAKLTKIGNMSTTITQGKMLDAVLETPINTLYPGPIRGLISRDVFSERGNNILIPKGSKIIGALKGGYTAGQSRVAVSWTRIILPSGYDIAITDAPGVGKLGMMGVEGVVNRQFMETIGSAALLSLINIATANITEDAFDIDSRTQTSSTSSSGTTTTTNTITPTQQAAEDAVNNLSSITKDWLSKNFLATPYIVINQGTRLKVFVNQDIKFPKNINSSILVK
ncbi:MAG: hypothetical protein HRU36_04675 [Rickettsiales bacterium]|nr:hypothetical protein [Rickettsiales bacterium]